MNRDDQIEKHLQRQPLKKIPPAWREEALGTARETLASRHASAPTRHSSWLRELFWPCPQAWAALAAVWVMILGVGYFTRDETMTASRQTSRPPSPQVRQLLKQQEQLLAELIGPLELPEADRPRSIAPQPRSQGRGEFLNA